MKNKTDYCWCESRTDYLSCHGIINNFKLLPVKNLKLKLDENTTETLKNNFINFLQTLGSYSVTDKGDHLGVDFDGSRIDFYSQHTITKNSLRSNSYRIPKIFEPWANDPKDLENNFIAKNRALINSISNTKELSKIHDFKKSAENLFMSSTDPTILVDNVGIISNKFIELFPQGTVDFITINKLNFILPLLIRNFSKQEIFGLGMTKSLLSTDWKERLPMSNEGNYFNILFNLFESGIYGICIPWLDRNLLLTFGKSIQLGSSDYLYSYVRGVDSGFLESGSKPKTEKFYLTNNDFRIFTGWYVSHINDLLNYLYCFGSFAKRKSMYINSIEQYKYIMTFEQITLLLVKILGTNDLVIKKQLTVIFLDLVSKLRFGSGGSINKLFQSKYLNEIIRNLEKLPSQFNSKYKEHAELIIQKLFNEVTDGVVPYYKKTNIIETPSKTFTINEYTGAYISALRNTIHGVHGSANGDFNEVIFINSGDTPNYLSNIASIIYLNILVAPNNYLRSENLTVTG